MKVAVTAQGPDVTSAVDPRFGRAKYFVVVDTETGEATAHDNAQILNAVQGAGIQAARNVVDLGVSAVITGNVGPKAFAALGAAGVTVHIGAEGSVQEAVTRFASGQMKNTDRPNVDGHWM